MDTTVDITRLHHRPVHVPRDRIRDTTRTVGDGGVDLGPPFTQFDVEGIVATRLTFEEFGEATHGLR